MRLMKLHDYDGHPVYINALAVTAIYYDKKKESTAIDYSTQETFYVLDYCEDVAKKVMEAVTAYEGRCLSVRGTR